MGLVIGILVYWAVFCILFGIGSILFGLTLTVVQLTGLFIMLNAVSLVFWTWNSSKKG